MEFKGTKGKWHTAESYDKKYRQACININAGDHIEGLATIWSASNELCNSTKADAQLISCAPEMLEMLVKVQSFIAANRGKNYMVELLRREIDGLDELITKATTI